MRLAVQHKYVIGLLCLFYVCIDCQRRRGDPKEEGTELTDFKELREAEQKKVDIATKEIQHKYKDITDFAKISQITDYAKIQSALSYGQSIRNDVLKQKERNIHSGLTELREHNLLKYEGVAWELEMSPKLPFEKVLQLALDLLEKRASHSLLRNRYTVGSTHEVTSNPYQGNPAAAGHHCVVWKHNVKEGILIGSNQVILNKGSKWKVKAVIRGFELKQVPGCFESVRIELEQIDDFQDSSDECLEALEGFVSAVPDPSDSKALNDFAARSGVKAKSIYVQGTKFAACQEAIYWTYVVKGHEKQLDGAELVFGGKGKDEWGFYLKLTETGGKYQEHCVRKYQAPTPARKLLNF